MMSERIIFRIESNVREALETKAAKSGKGLSEYIRSLIMADLNEFETYRLADGTVKTVQVYRGEFE